MGKRGKLTVLVCACAAPALLLLGTTPALAAYEVKSNDSSINDGTLGQRVGTACDDGVSVSGGAYNDASYADGVYLTEMLPFNPFASRHRSWTVGADNYPGGAPSNTFSVQVICDLQNGWNDYDRIERQNGLKVPDDKLGGATVKCPAGHPVVGGGYDEDGFFDEEAYLSMSAPVDGKDADKVPDDGWRFEVNNDEDVGGKVVKGTVTAICDKRRPSSAYHYRADQKNVQDASQGILSRGMLQQRDAHEWRSRGEGSIQREHAAQLLQLPSCRRSQLVHRRRQLRHAGREDPQAGGVRHLPALSRHATFERWPRTEQATLRR